MVRVRVLSLIAHEPLMMNVGPQPCKSCMRLLGLRGNLPIVTLIGMILSTLNIVFDVTYYLELFLAIIICYNANKGQNYRSIGCLDVIGLITSLLGEILH